MQHAQQQHDQEIKASQRGRQAGNQDNLCDRGVPGTCVQWLSHMTCRCFMSDMTYSIAPHDVPGTMMFNEGRSKVAMPGMLMFCHLSSCTCSHVGYKKLSRLATCPGQCAHLNSGRFVTCPGQCAHSSNSRSETCPGQCARTGRTETCPGQCAP